MRKEEREKEHGERSVNKNNELQDVAHPEEISGTPLIEKEANEEQLIITLYGQPDGKRVMVKRRGEAEKQEQKASQ